MVGAVVVPSLATLITAVSAACATTPALRQSSEQRYSHSARETSTRSASYSVLSLHKSYILLYQIPLMTALNIAMYC
jgi:hypothetical protein